MGEVMGEVNPFAPRFQRFVERIGDSIGSMKVDRLPIVAPTLLGRVAMISVFVGRDGQDWTDEEIAKGLDAVERAGKWIERQAIRHAAPVNLGLVETYFRVRNDQIDEVEVEFVAERDEVGPLEANATTKAIIDASRAAASLGFADVVDLFVRINARIEADARVWLFHTRRKGRSIAIPAGECDVHGVGLALCFAREANFPEPLAGPGRVDPTTVAHELLHLFGASDKYGVELRSFPPGSVSSKDIMRLNFDQLARMTIDQLTAIEIGWEPDDGLAPTTKNARRQPGRSTTGDGLAG